MMLYYDMRHLFKLFPEGSPLKISDKRVCVGIFMSTSVYVCVRVFVCVVLNEASLQGISGGALPKACDKRVCVCV
jgi:hypothetical protein